LCAIARALHVSSDVLREQLVTARQDGRLLDLPCNDWPPGQSAPRLPQHRAPLDAMQQLKSDYTLSIVRRMFRLTHSEAVLLLTLLRATELSKHHNAMSAEAIDVHVCRLRRRLRLYDVEIKTIWGYGYEMPASSRHKALQLITDAVAA
jgi:hypothetical protein